MQPTLMFQSLEPGTGRSPLSSAALLPEDAAQPQATFADALQRGLDAGSPGIVMDGQPLPLAGNPLPITELENTLLPESPEADLPTEVAGDWTVEVPLRSSETVIEFTDEAPLAVDIEIDIESTATTEPLADAELVNPLTGTLPEGAGDDLLAEAALNRATPQPSASPNPAATAAAAAPTAVPGNAAAAPGAVTALEFSQTANLQAQPAAPLVATTLNPQTARQAALPAASAEPQKGLPDVDVLRPIAGSDRPADPEALTRWQIDAAATASTARQAPDQPPLTAALTATSSAARTPATPVPVATAIDLPIDDPNWGERLSERVVVMAGNRIQNAEIRLSPAEMGPVRIQIAVDDGAANVVFHATQAATRDAIEQALPRLREMLSDSGVTLGQSTVSEQDVRQGREESAAEFVAAGNTDESDIDGIESDPGSMASGPSRGRGLVDTFV